MPAISQAPLTVAEVEIILEWLRNGNLGVSRVDLKGGLRKLTLYHFQPAPHTQLWKMITDDR